MKIGAIMGLILGFSLVLVTGFAQGPTQTKTSLEWAGLKGPVKSVFHVSHIAVLQGDSIVRGTEEWENSGSGNWLYVYNRAGYEIEEVEYSTFGTMRIVTIRDSLNRDVEEYSYDSEGQLTYKSVSKYNAFGLLAEGLSYDNDDRLLSVVSFLYDGIGNKIEERVHNYKSYFSDEETLNSFYFEYDKKNNLVRQTGGRMKFEYRYLYNKNGQQIDEKVMDSTGLMFIHTLSDYDQNGYLIQRQRIENRGEGDNSSECSRYEYDAQGNQLRYIRCDGDCKPLSAIVKSYDDHNRIVEYLEVDVFGAIEATYTYRYKVDQFGNWTHMYVYLNGKPTYIIERVMEYYN